MPRFTAAHTSTLMILLALLGAPAASAQAADGKAKQKVEAALKEKKSAQAALSEKSRQLESETTSLQKKLINMSKGLRDLEEDLAEGKSRLGDLQKKKNALSDKLFAEQDTVGGLVTAAQRFNRTSTPTLMAQSDPLEAARAARVMKTMIPALHAKSSALRAEIAALDKVEQDIGREQAALKQSMTKINSEEAKLNDLLAQRRKDLQQTESERKANETEVTRLAREAKNLEELVEKIEKPRAKPVTQTAAAAVSPRMAGDNATPPPTGTVRSPVPGTVRTAFGAVDDLGATSRGITYHARSNARVVTPLSGTVRFAGPFHKYKHILIIEHAGGYHSLIAGLGRVDTVVGAKLAAGEPVGSVDQSDADHHPVYYELRRNGTPINPQKILVAQRKQDKS